MQWAMDYFRRYVLLDFHPGCNWRGRAKTPTSCFSSDISARVSWSESLANVISGCKMEVYNICTLSYVGSHRDGYFWLYLVFLRISFRAIVTNRKNFQTYLMVDCETVRIWTRPSVTGKKRKISRGRLKIKTLWRKSEGNWSPFGMYSEVADLNNWT